MGKVRVSHKKYLHDESEPVFWDMMATIMINESTSMGN